MCAYQFKYQGRSISGPLQTWFERRAMDAGRAGLPLPASAWAERKAEQGQRAGFAQAPRENASLPPDSIFTIILNLLFKQILIQYYPILFNRVLNPKASGTLPRPRWPPPWPPAPLCRISGSARQGEGNMSSALTSTHCCGRRCTFSTNYTQ